MTAARAEARGRKDRAYTSSTAGDRRERVRELAEGFEHPGLAYAWATGLGVLVALSVTVGLLYVSL